MLRSIYRNSFATSPENIIPDSDKLPIRNKIKLRYVFGNVKNNIDLIKACEINKINAAFKFPIPSAKTLIPIVLKLSKQALF